MISPDPIIKQVMKEVQTGKQMSEMSYSFHMALINCLTDICIKLRDTEDISIVALSGGCFQNQFLLKNMISRLEQNRFEVLSHSQIPTNDGGLALGQAVIASYNMT